MGKKKKKKLSEKTKNYKTWEVSSVQDSPVGGRMKAVVVPGCQVHDAVVQLILAVLLQFVLVQFNVYSISKMIIPRQDTCKSRNRRETTRDQRTRDLCWYMAEEFFTTVAKKKKKDKTKKGRQENYRNK